MAASLAVEWAKKGVRVNTLRYDDVIIRFLSVAHFVHSPGYMLTKLTRTILAHDQELKVRVPALLVEVICSPRGVLPQKTWESLTPMGRVSPIWLSFSWTVNSSSLA